METHVFCVTIFVALFICLLVFFSISLSILVFGYFPILTLHRQNGVHSARVCNFMKRLSLALQSRERKKIEEDNVYLVLLGKIQHAANMHIKDKFNSMIKGELSHFESGGFNVKYIYLHFSSFFFCSPANSIYCVFVIKLCFCFAFFYISMDTKHLFNFQLSAAKV